MSERHDDERTLRVEDEALAEGFTMIPNIILKRRDLSRDAKILYAVLLSYAWQKDSCFPGYDALMADLQCGRPQIAKYIRELKTAGVLTVKRRGQGLTSIYTLKIRVGTEKFQNETSRSSDSELPGVPKRNGEEYPVKEDPEEEDRVRIERYIHDFGRIFKDQAPLRSSVQRAANLYQSSGKPWEDFTQAMYRAREKTQAATNVKNRMSYFFACLEEELD